MSVSLPSQSAARVCSQILENMEGPPSRTVRKFLSSGGKVWEQDPNYDYNAFRKEFYFFYGSLMDLSTLAKVLQLLFRPNLYPSQIVGYSCKLWGPYPALVDGPPGAIVYGMAYEVQSSEEADRLQAYETDHYIPRACTIKLQNGMKVGGKVFMWNVDKSLLKEGVFDLKDWQMKNLEES